ncbi:MAG: hypothetical protein ABJL99_14235 [Aliishimia sp.]
MTKVKMTALAGIMTLSAGLHAMAETWNFTISAGQPPLTKGITAI